VIKNFGDHCHRQSTLSGNILRKEDYKFIHMPQPSYDIPLNSKYMQLA